MTIQEVNAWTGIGTVIGLVIVGVLNQLEARRAAKIASQIHTLVNSQMGIQLRVNMLQARDIAEMTTDPSRKRIAIQVAEEATRLYEDHQKKQAIVDSDAHNKP